MEILQFQVREFWAELGAEVGFGAVGQRPDPAEDAGSVCYQPGEFVRAQNYGRDDDEGEQFKRAHAEKQGGLQCVGTTARFVPEASIQ
ncbi:hypothetical protein [Streptomyces sp. NPDC096934]|uniref:hypothetical protein n=1 Tax=Streptomyces sp. NPDC096934 TaxID=3155551 RepID=UPI003316B1D5